MGGDIGREAVFGGAVFGGRAVAHFPPAVLEGVSALLRSSS